MDIKSLPRSVRTRLRSGIKITNVPHCITELVLNSLDAKSSAVVVRVNLSSCRLQVIDNGSGISKSNMYFLGIRFMTSKCQSITNLENKSKFYGFRGETLSSLVEVSNNVNVVSRTGESQETFSADLVGKTKPVLVKKRPSKGTTVTVEGFLHSFPVRKNRINPELDFEDMKSNLLSLAIIHPEVSFSLRNDSSGKIIFQNKKTDSVLESFKAIYPGLVAEEFAEIKISKGKTIISGLLYKKTHVTPLQYIYVNKRPICSSKIKSVLNSLLTRSKIHQKDEKTAKKFVYVINIRCPHSEVDLVLNPNKTTAEFKNFNLIHKALHKVLAKVLELEDAIVTPLVNDVKSIHSHSGVSQIQGAFKSRPTKRKIKGNNAQQLQIIHNETKSIEKTTASTASPCVNQNTKTMNAQPQKKKKKIESAIQNETNVTLKEKTNDTHAETEKKQKKILQKDKNPSSIQIKNRKRIQFENNITKPSSNELEDFEVVCLRNKRKTTEIDTEIEAKKQSFDISPSDAFQKESKSGISHTLNRLVSATKKKQKKYNSQRIGVRKICTGTVHIEHEPNRADANDFFKIFNRTTEKSNETVEESQVPPLNIFEKHANTQSLVLNSELSTKFPERNTQESLERLEKDGKNLILDLFLQSTQNYNERAPETIHKKQNTTMTLSVCFETENNRQKLISVNRKACVVEERIETVKKRDEKPASMRFSRNESNYLFNYETRAQNKIQHVEKASKYTQTNLDSFELVSKCLQTTNLNKPNWTFRFGTEHTNKNTIFESNPTTKPNIFHFGTNSLLINNPCNVPRTNSNMFVEEPFRINLSEKEFPLKHSETKNRNLFDLKKFQQLPKQTLNTPFLQSERKFSWEFSKKQHSFVEIPIFLQKKHVKTAPKRLDFHQNNFVYEQTEVNNSREPPESSYDDPKLRTFNSHVYFDESKRKNKQIRDDREREQESSSWKRLSLKKRSKTYETCHQLISDKCKQVSTIKDSVLIHKPPAAVEYTFPTPNINSSNFSTFNCSFKSSTTPETQRKTPLIEFHNSTQNEIVEINDSSSDFISNSEDEGNFRPIITSTQKKGTQTLNLPKIKEREQTNENKTKEREQTNENKTKEREQTNENKTKEIEKTKDLLITEINSLDNLNPKKVTENIFGLKKRIDFIPKGFSPILKEIKPIDTSLSPNSKVSLVENILENNHQLNIVKWENYLQNKDAKKFFDEIYEEKKKICSLNVPDISKNVKTDLQIPKNLFKSLEVIGQWDNKFIVTMKGDLLFLFDQHAVHERIRLETLLNSTDVKFQSRQHNIKIFLNRIDTEILKTHQRRLEKFGLKYEINQDYLNVTHVPECVYEKGSRHSTKCFKIVKLLVKTLIEEEISDLKVTRGVVAKIPRVLLNIFNSEACRGAVKFGDYLHLVDCRLLIEQLSRCRLPFQCAHGRPTLVPLIDLKRQAKHIKIRLERLKYVC